TPRSEGQELDQAAGLLVSRCSVAVLVAAPVIGAVPETARGDARQGGQLPPAEGGARGRELFRHRAIVLLPVQPAVLGDREAKEEVEHRTGWVTELTVALHHGRGVELIVFPDRALQLPKQGIGVDRLDALQVLRQREGVLLVAAIATVLRPAVTFRDVSR